ncbi:MAG: histidine triad nucleotide-binding protein [Eubacteriales bacterium]|nr:histidine triad nucleotide-binding protein [Eubacteriales bacterium]MDD4717179.1 histidine triad nucleotide-binding protein [Eubacteriales bacterium]NCU25249.1 histidine triad nucleotide-binding protein [Candidatus Nomurabacteria bacterium]
MVDCVFCRIASHELGSKIVYEDDSIICFHDINPSAPVHILIVPKHHYTDIMELSSDKQAAAEVLGTVMHAIEKVTEITGVDKKGFRIINNCGFNGGQTIPHLHFHLLGGMKLREKLI